MICWFNKEECPENNGAKGCPAWWETLWTAPDGREEWLKSCAFQQLPRYLIEVIKASNRPAAAMESVRNEMVAGLGLLAEGLREYRPHGHQRLPQGPNHKRHIKVLEDKQHG